MSVHTFPSKKKARQAERDARRVRGMKARLAKIAELAKLIHNEQELDIYLRDIPDDEVRAETKKLIEPFLFFKIQHVKLTDAAPETPEKATQVVLH